MRSYQVILLSSKRIFTLLSRLEAEERSSQARWALGDASAPKAITTPTPLCWSPGPQSPPYILGKILCYFPWSRCYLS